MVGMSLNQKMEQRQVLKQQQLFSLQLLAMDDMELEHFLEDEQLKNPFIQVEKETSPVRMEFRETHENSWYGKQVQNPSNDTVWSEWTQAEEIFDLWTFLSNQMTQALTKHEEIIFRYMTEAIDSRGYLLQSNDEIAKVLQLEKEKVVQVRNYLQALDPPGIGANSLAECLCIQLQRLPEDTTLAQTIVWNDLEDAADGKFYKIAQKYQTTLQLVHQSISLIQSLNPIPINGLGNIQKQYVVPDIIVSKEDGNKEEWIISLNASSASKVVIATEYENLLKDNLDAETLTYCRQNRSRVVFLQKCIEQRKQTLFQLAAYILKKQQHFIEGKGPLIPMLIRDAAEAISVNESTISRAIKHKYIQFPSGCWKIRDLFTKAIGEDQQLSENQIKEEIKKLIENEDCKRPLSDQKLAEKLNHDAGIVIARRTVTKYREEMQIPSTRIRKIIE